MYKLNKKKEIESFYSFQALRLTCPVKFANEVNEMLDALLPELDRFSELAILHVALVATGIQSFHPAVLR